MNYSFLDLFLSSTVSPQQQQHVLVNSETAMDLTMEVNQTSSSSALEVKENVDNSSVGASDNISWRTTFQSDKTSQSKCLVMVKTMGASAQEQLPTELYKSNKLVFYVIVSGGEICDQKLHCQIEVWNGNTDQKISLNNQDVLDVSSFDCEPISNCVKQWKKAKLSVQIENTSSKLCFGSQKIKILDCSYHHQEAPFYFTISVKDGEELLFQMKSEKRMVRARRPDQPTKKRAQETSNTEDEVPNSKKQKTSQKQSTPTNTATPTETTSQLDIYSEAVPELQSFKLALEGLFHDLPSNSELRKVALKLLEQRLGEALQQVEVSTSTNVPSYGTLGVLIQNLPQDVVSPQPKECLNTDVMKTMDFFEGADVFQFMEKLVQQN